MLPNFTRFPPIVRTALALALPATATLAAPARAEEPAVAAPAASASRLDWFREARFGMFIHWGLYSLPAGEYTDPKTGKTATDHGEWYLKNTGIPLSRYATFADKFDPVGFDADKWAQAAADAGVKYLCITGKHHDGFAMFPSAVTKDWNLAITPFGKKGRDPLMELKVACEKRGVAFCLYHTVLDWHSADYGNRLENNDLPAARQPANMDAFQAFLHASTAEVVARYHPKMMWFDGAWEGNVWTDKRGAAFQAHLRKIAPEMVINDRVGPGAGGLQGVGDQRRFGDYATPEQFIPKEAPPPGVVWETCMTMNDHWGFNKVDRQWKSAETLVRNLVEVASKGGNYLLNVGPDARGEIPEAGLERLAAIGRWMKVNGESIYGTGASPFKDAFPWGRVTAKGDTWYLHVFKRPADGKITLPVNRPVDAVLLAGGAVASSVSGESLEITLPETLPDTIDTVVKIASKK